MRGGYRPNSGPAKGTKYRPRKPKPGQEATPKPDTKKPKAKVKKPKEPTEREKLKAMLAMGIKAKAKFYQDFLVRVSHNEKLTVSEQKMMDKLGAELAEDLGEKEPGPPKAEGEKLEPLEYMLKVMNDPTENPDMRARMAVAAAPYRHARKGEGVGKKQEREDRAKAAGAGRFAPSAAPILKMVKK